MSKLFVKLTTTTDVYIYIIIHTLYEKCIYRTFMKKTYHISYRYNLTNFYVLFFFFFYNTRTIFLWIIWFVHTVQNNKREYNYTVALHVRIKWNPWVRNSYVILEIHDIVPISLLCDFSSVVWNVLLNVKYFYQTKFNECFFTIKTKLLKDIVVYSFVPLKCTHVLHLRGIYIKYKYGQTH